MKKFETVDAKTKHWHNVKPGDDCEPLSLTGGEYMIETKGDFSGGEMVMKFGFSSPEHDVFETGTHDLSEPLKMPQGIWRPEFDGDKGQITVTIRKLG